jgi:cytochrome c553
VKRFLLRLGGLLAVVGVVAAVAVVAGLPSIKASSGHWPVTAWFLHFTMERSVATRSLGIEPPPLDDAARVLRGAGHYETGCRPCHGAPLPRRHVIPQQMTPHPPELALTVPEWKDRELFYIVKHGVKMTGMPAWPAQHREDEVWDLVAFLRVLPALTPADYDRLVYGELPIGPPYAASHAALPLSLPSGVAAEEPVSNVPAAVLSTCGRCHDLDGRGRGEGAFPNLAGQSAIYLRASLRAYAEGRRHSGVMQPLAAGLGADAIDALARWFASRPPAADLGVRPPAPSAPPLDVALVERGRAIATGGLPERRIPSCIDCHGPTAEPRNPHYPTLAGQPAGYLVQQLELFKKDHRGGTPYAHLMQEVAPRLTPQEIESVAHYYASLPPTATSP